MRTLLALLPLEVLPVVLVGGGLAVMFGSISAGRLLGLVATLVVLHVVGEALWPLAGELFSSLSVWWQVCVVVVGGVLLLRFVLKLVFGVGLADRAVGFLVWHGLLRLPVRMLGALVGVVFGRRALGMRGRR